MISTRREFNKLVLLGGAALSIGFSFDETSAQEATPAKPFVPNGWVQVDPDGTVTLTVGKSEMGQGIRTSLAMIVAEELDAAWDAVKIRQASPNAQYTGLGTGGSWSVRGMWGGLRVAGASARAMLVAAAATRMNVDAASLTTKNGRVIHAASNRSLGYGELVADAAALPIPEKPPLKETKDYALVGKPTRRVDAKAIVTGKAVYGLDVTVPGMKYAVLAKPVIHGGSVKSFDAAPAKRVRGVRDVVKISSGVAVVADSSWSALKGREALVVEFDPGPHSAFSTASHFQRLREGLNGNAAVSLRTEGDGLKGLEGAHRLFEAVYEYPFYAHAAMETLNCVAHVQEGRCEIWVSTQAPNTAQERVAALLGIPLEAVTIHVTLLGGGFGRRLGVDYVVEAVEISRAAKVPVKLFWTRQDDMQQGFFQAAALHRMQAAVDAEGRVTAFAHRKASSPHNARRRATAQQLIDPEYLRGNAAWGVYDLPYEIPAQEASYVVVDTHIPIGPWRAVFAPSSNFARESFVDELAHATGKDPLQFRLDLLKGEDIIAAAGMPIDRRRTRRVLEELRVRSDWGKPLPKGMGRGVAICSYSGVTHVGYTAEVSVKDGNVRVHRVVCVIDCGLVVNPLGLEAQVESGVIWSLSSALKGEITFDGGSTEQSTFGDFDVLRLDETPKIETYIIQGAPEPYGAGEPTVPPVVPAVFNAIFAATGKRLRKMPVKREHLAG